MTKLWGGGGRFILNAVLLTLVLIMVMIPDVFAATINVNVDILVCDDDLIYCTIQAAINAAVSGDTIIVAAGTYSITSDLIIDKKIILQGSGNGGDPLVDTIIELAPPSSTSINLLAGGPSTDDRLEIRDLRVTDTKDSHTGAARSVEIKSSGFFLFDNVVMTNNIGTALIIRGDLPGGASTSDVVVQNSIFSNNAQASCSNPADIHFFLFEGNARVENVSIDVGTGSHSCTAGDKTSNSYGIQFRGNGNNSPAGTIVLQDVTITGNPNKVGLLIQEYSDTSGFSLSNVDLSNIVTSIGSFWPTSLIVVHSGTTPLDIGNLKTQEIWNNDIGGINAEQAQFFDSSITPITDNFTIEDIVVHTLDADSLGLVRWVPNNVYVTPNSGSVQRGIDVVQAVDTVNVGPGITAINNYWRHATGPTHIDNPGGLGITIGGTVSFNPWYLNSARTNLSSDQSGNKIKPQGNTVKFDSDDANSGTKGKASLPPGIEEIELGNDAVIDVVANIDTAIGNNIQVGGITKVLSSFTSGTLTGVDLTTTKTVGDKAVLVKKAVKLESGTDNKPVIIKNVALPSVSVSIPDGTTILGPDEWTGTIQPPKTGSSSGTAPSGFSVGNTVIEVGSPDVVLLFDNPVDVLLSGVTGNVGYKPAGSSTWIQITNVCGGTFDSPDDPVFPGECFISNGVDTKIFTYHFTTFGGLDAIAKKSGSGAGGDRTKPVLQSNSLSSPGSVIFGGTLALDPSQPPETSLFEINDEINLELSFFENQGPETIQHVALYVNIRDFDTRNDSDLWIEWNKGQPIKIHDPNGFLKDDANVTTAINDANLDMTFHVTFVKPMETSNIVLYLWDFSRNGALVTFEDAWKIVEPVSDLIDVAESGDLDQTMEEGFVETETEESPVLPIWLKNNAGWWADGQIGDSTFTNGIQYMIQENIIHVPNVSQAVNVSEDPDAEPEEEDTTEETMEIPSWIKNNAKWWSEGMITDEAFIQSIQWLIANGVIVI
ncbi:MAG: hypothetical protein NPMRTH1_400004 [Nitrosopumilales archaeon]|nr:MAG: hypothetical protein NPMRTH1_400004 [Nitrosopumilales archaeon]